LDGQNVSAPPQLLREYVPFQTYPGGEVVANVPTWKRILDYVVILLTLPLGVLLVILIAMWIKIHSPGPIFFRQERVGYRGKRFMMLKFRTMKVNVETQSHERYLEQLISANRPMTKDAYDKAKIIYGGGFLRAMGLDELPQLLHVLLGQMSLSGPRPCTPHEFLRYKEWYKERVNVLPGLTGYWQVNGKNKTTFTEMMNMDIFYARHMSLWLDLVIIVKTPPVILEQVREYYTARHRSQDPEGSKETSPIKDLPH
jgi:lipopolysaccharide/colanic/teichoic acid biosynthesis glycosyltransferase